MLALRLLASAQHCILIPFHLRDAALTGKPHWQKSCLVGMYSLELRGSVSKSWVKEVSDY